MANNGISVRAAPPDIELPTVPPRSVVKKKRALLQRPKTGSLVVSASATTPKPGPSLLPRAHHSGCS